MTDVVLVGAELEENLALRYLRGSLEAAGFRTAQVDFDCEADLERAAGEIARSGARIAGFSMVFTHRSAEFARLIGRCRELGFRGLTIAGGHFAAFHAEDVLREVPALDAIAVGEGERILCEVARSPDDLGRIEGLVWRGAEGLRRNPPAQPEQDLDRLAWPVRKRPFDAYLGLPIVNMLGSRGCSHSCGFCSIAAWHRLCGGARYRTRSPQAIAAEIGCLWREGVRLFNFHDDNFLGRDRDANLDRARALRDALTAQGVGRIGFQIKARPDCVDRELFAFLRSMGLYRVFLGIEAGTEESLARLGRGQKLADNVRALEVLNGLDLHVAFNLLLLNPDSTLEDFEANVAFLRAHDANPMNFCRTEIYTGTPLEKRMRAQGRLRGDYWGLDYVIADPRAERAYVLMREAFYERNFGDYPLNYLSGQVDYEHQIRAVFFGATADLRERAKGYVRAVNQSSVRFLEEIAERARAGKGKGGGDAEVEDLARRVRQDDFRLQAEGRRILAALRDLSDLSRKPSTSGARAALAGAVALALAGCSTPATHAYEAAPLLPDRDEGDAGVAATADAAAPAGLDASTTAGPDAATPVLKARDTNPQDLDRFRMQMEAAPYLPDRLPIAPPEAPTPDAGRAARKGAKPAATAPADAGQPAALVPDPVPRDYDLGMHQREAAPHLPDRDRMIEKKKPE